MIIVNVEIRKMSLSYKCESTYIHLGSLRGDVKEIEEERDPCKDDERRKGGALLVGGVEFEDWLRESDLQPRGCVGRVRSQVYILLPAALAGDPNF